MRIEVRELDRLHVQEQRSLLGEAVRTVNESHGRMSHVPHFVGSALAGVMVLWVWLDGRGVVVGVLAGLVVYSGALFVGMLLWRRSMTARLREVVRELLEARGRVPMAARRLFTVEETFVIKGRGVVLLPGIVPGEGKRFWMGDPIELRRPDGSVMRAPIGGFEMFYPRRDDWVVVLIGLTKEQVPVGTEVWSVDSDRANFDSAR